MLSLLIYEDFPPMLLTTTFSNFVQRLSPTYVSSLTPTPIVLSVALFIWLNEWSGHIWCAILCNDNMDLHMSSLRTLVPKGPCVCFMQQGAKFPEVWHMRSATLIWYHTNKTHATHSGGSRLTHTYKYIKYYVNSTTCYVLKAAACVKFND